MARFQKGNHAAPKIRNEHMGESRKLFRRLTIELLQHKYRYYVLDAPILTDYEYDMKEKHWRSVGEIIGYDMDAYEHWVDFDVNHPLAKIALKAFPKKEPEL